LVERLVRNEKARGSNPLTSSGFPGGAQGEHPNTLKFLDSIGSLGLDSVEISGRPSHYEDQRTLSYAGVAFLLVSLGLREAEDTRFPSRRAILVKQCGESKKFGLTPLLCGGSSKPHVSASP
jgi:hypothetical protein